MKKNLFVCLAAGLSPLLTAGSCLEAQHVTGSDNYIAKKMEVPPFNAVRSMGSMNIVYHQDAQTRVELHGSDNIIPLVETTVEGNTLTIKLKKNTIVSKGKLEVKVFAPELNELTINGSGNVYFANGIQTKEDVALTINGSGDIKGKDFHCRKMSVAINGSGDIKLRQIESQGCTAGISGSGDIDLEGKTLNAEYHIAGSGDIDATALEAENVSASTTGSGDIRCHATAKLTARVTGSGDISYRGNPQEIDAPRKNIHRID